MSGYKAGYSEKHSPYFDAGRADGVRDKALIEANKEPLGMAADKAGSAMYQRGYAKGLGE